MTEKLMDAGYELAEEYRMGKWTKQGDLDSNSAWFYLIKELELRCPGFSEEEYRNALNDGFTSSR